MIRSSILLVPMAMMMIMHIKHILYIILWMLGFFPDAMVAWYRLFMSNLLLFCWFAVRFYELFSLWLRFKRTGTCFLGLVKHILNETVCVSTKTMKQSSIICLRINWFISSYFFIVKVKDSLDFSVRDFMV